MLPTVFCALMGAYIGMSSRSWLSAALIAAGLTATAYYVLVYAAAFLIAFAPDPWAARRMLTTWGATASSLTMLVQTAVASAAVCGILLSLFAPREDSGRQEAWQA